MYTDICMTLLLLLPLLLPACLLLFTGWQQKCDISHIEHDRIQMCTFFHSFFLFYTYYVSERDCDCLKDGWGGERIVVDVCNFICQKIRKMKKNTSRDCWRLLCNFHPFMLRASKQAGRQAGTLSYTWYMYQSFWINEGEKKLHISPAFLFTYQWPVNTLFNWHRVPLALACHIQLKLINPLRLNSSRYCQL